MKKHDGSLFQIGEVVKIMGVTRKALLVFENMGLLTPALKDEDSGYRYYSADNLMQIKAIRSLQKLGLTLKEVAAYYYDTDNIDIYIQNLKDQRAALDYNIQMLEARAAKRGDLTVRETMLPGCVCFCQQHVCRDITQASKLLRETYLAALTTKKTNTHNRMFTLRMSESVQDLNLLCCIPVDDSFDGPERMVFEATPALCVYYRGPYEQLWIAMQSLLEYVEKHNIKTTGPFRNIYLEGPPNHGNKSENYVTQIAVPIQ